MMASTSMNTELDSRVLHELIQHFQDRPQVQNIDVMNTAGFCRNCLAKWRHKHARELGLEGSTYEQAMEYVYGMPYEEYKKKHQAKATAEQLERFKHAELHAVHEGFDVSPVPRSSVCCDAEGNEVAPSGMAQQDDASRFSGSKTFQEKPVRVGVLTLSDRASRGDYTDQSGPAVVTALETFAPFHFVISSRSVLPDDLDQIVQTLTEWSKSCEVIITTGGTGIGRRDVTPEATLKVIDRKLPGITELVRRESAKKEPLAWLSRAEAGTLGSCLIINFPGHPSAATDGTKIVCPLIPRMVALSREL